MSDIISLGEWIKRRRKAIDLTQEELAQRVGCSLATIQKIEGDARRPSRELAALLADHLELPANERSAFIQAARAELGADRLAPPSQSVGRSAFVPASGMPASPPEEASSPSMQLPSGTVTFLFTDIAGSTRLWEQHSQAMQAALARHDTILREAITAHEGMVVKTTGDGIHAVFTRATDALDAALAAQRALHAESWGDVGALRVRMALHTGRAEVRDGDYFGQPLNRAARLMASGHGGQILLSLATEQLVREHLPPDVGLNDLGTHRLKDLSLPERIFQLVAPDLPATFPTLNTLDARRTNLPAQLTALIGRQQEVAMVSTLLRRSDVRLVSLTGPGGVGKTRLSLQVAAELVEEFADGVYFVDLAPIRAPQLVSSAIAQTLGVRETGGQPLLATLKEYLRDKRTLLLLDNFEQIIDAAPLVAELLSAAPQLKVLATSREVLHLRSEYGIAVQPLGLPDPTQLPPLDQLSQYAAVALFIQCAQATQHAFQVTTASAPAVAEICVRLDGLPLAIELAAARLKLFAPAALLARLSSRLALLSGGPRDLPARQQTIRDTIAWSYDLLSNDEQTLFRRMGVFVGGCTLEAAEHVLGAEGRRLSDGIRDSAPSPQTSVLDGLAALLDKSLARQTGDGDAMRFTMLETIREFALERLEASGEAEQLRRQHAAYYLAYGEQQWSISRDSAYEAWVDRFRAEYTNMRAALDWSQTTAGDAEMALRLANTMHSLWYSLGTWNEAIAAFEHSLNHPYRGGRTSAHTKARMGLAEMLAYTGKYTAAQSHYQQALELAQEFGETAYQAEILERLGWMARERGDTATAWAYLTQALEMFRKLDNNDWIAGTLNSMAGVAIEEEDPARAEALLAKSRAVAQQGGVDSSTIFWTLNHLGNAAQLSENYERAAQLHQESLGMIQGVGAAPWGSLSFYQSMGETTLGLGRLDEAARWLAQGLAASQTLNEQPNMAWCLAGLGSVAALDEEPERAARLWGAAERLRQAIGCRSAPAARATYERAMATARAQLGDEAFAAAWAEGRAMSLEQAIAEALRAAQ